MDVKEMLKGLDAYREGFQKGREMAVQNYDKILIGLYDEIKEIKEILKGGQ